MSNSPLVDYVKRSPNHSGKRNHVIDTVSIHCMAGNASVETCGALFANPARKASSNYGIGSDGRIALYVDEANRSWCTSSASNDHRAITIEVANNGGAPDWPVSAQAYEALIRLLVDICQRNPGIGRLRWQGNKSLIGQVTKQNMTVHRWFAAKACPGDYLYNRHGQIAAEVNRRLDAETKPMEEDEDMTQDKFNEMFATAMTSYLKKLQDNDAGDWSAADREWGIASGLFNGSGTLPNGEPNYMWQMWTTREQLAALLHRFKQGID